MMFEGKTILITGSSHSKGMGAATARKAKEYGAQVILHGRAEGEEVKALAQELDASYIICDVTDKAAVEKAVAEKLQSGVKVDALVNAAGASKAIPFLEADDDNWLSMYQTNLLGTVHFCQALIPHMQANGHGRIVNVASIRGHEVTSSNRGMAYSASKGAVLTLTSTLAKEFAPVIAVNAVSPGFVNTDMTSGWNETVWNQVKTALVGRIGEPEELAEAILFLASDRASFVTGQALVVDGGYTISGK